jgi:rhodanese-related sulfurtransferase
MNRFLKNNSTWIGLSTLALCIIFLAYTFKPSPPEYRLNASQSLKLINDRSLAIEVKDIEGKQVIDIRPAELFSRGHFENAVNIPARQILDLESIRFFRQLKSEGKIAVLYGSDELQAISPWLLLQQLGYKDILRLKGGFTADNKLTETNLQSTESSVLDAAVLHANQGASFVSKTLNDKPKPESVNLVKKTSATGGGC